MLRSVLAVVVGYVVLAVCTTLMIGALGRAFPEYNRAEESHAAPPLLPVVLNLLLGVPCAAVGGFTTAWLARRAPLVHAAALAVIVLALGGLYALTMSGGPQPTWYLVLLPVCGAVGIFAGGWAGSGRRATKAAARR